MADQHTSTTPLQQAGLAPTRFSDGSISLWEVENPTLIRVHTLETPEATAAALANCGFPASTTTNTSRGGERMALCLRPGEWMLFSEQGASETLISEVRAALDPALNSVLPQSEGLACFRLQGAGVPWLLSKLGSLDFLAGRSEGQHCARTRLAQVGVLVHYHPANTQGDSFVYDLIFDRSIAAYLWKLLLSNAPHANELAQTNK